MRGLRFVVPMDIVVRENGRISCCRARALNGGMIKARTSPNASQAPSNIKRRRTAEDDDSCTKATLTSSIPNQIRLEFNDFSFTTKNHVFACACKVYANHRKSSSMS